MASQRRAPTKRPPRPASKKTAPPPGASEGTDAAQSGAAAKTPAPTSAPPAPSPAPRKPPNTPKTSTSGTARSTSGTPRSTTGTPRASTTGTAKSSTVKPGSTPATRGTSSGGGARTGTGGPNYRPPSGAARTRQPPPPRRKKKRATKKTFGAIVALVAIAAVVVFFSFAVNGSSSSTTTTIPSGAASATGPEGVPIPNGTTLAATDSSRYPQTIDQIKCQTNEQVAYHIHVHLTIFVNGQARQIPYGIGVTPPLQTTSQSGTFVDGGTCYYWLHTHADDGVIHVESPTQTTYDLGNFFDMWGQPLSSDQVGPAVGPLTVFLNGKPYTGDPRLIPLVAHSQIQIDAGSPVVPAQPQITFPTGL
jgi:hypothetical protein